MRDKTKKPILVCMFDQFWLRMNTGISANEYYIQSIVDLKTKKKFEYIGQFGSKAWQTVNIPEKDTILMDDKMLFDNILTEAGIATGKTLVVFSKTAPEKHCPVIRDIAILEDWLLESEGDIFIKPLLGINGKGTLSIGKRLSTEPPSWEQMPLGQPISLVAILEHLQSQDTDQFIIQKRLIPGEETSSFSSNVLQTLRVMSLRTNNEICITAAALKIGSGKSEVDNFLHGKNLIAAVDLDTGKLGSAVEIVDGNPIWHSKHPISGACIEGYCLKSINEVKALVVRAAECFPSLYTVGWDVALTEDGPLILEGNYWADIMLIQIAHKKGLLSWPEYKTLFDENNLYRKIGMGFMRPV